MNLADDQYASVYIGRYIDFLVCLNDDNNTRALFERALALIPASRSSGIWQKYISYETQYGDLGQLHKLQARRDAAIGTQGDVDGEKQQEDLMEGVVNMAEKWGSYDIDCIAESELGLEAVRAFGRLPPPLTASTKPGIGAARGIDTNRSGSALVMLPEANADRYPRPDLSVKPI